MIDRPLNTIGSFKIVVFFVFFFQIGRKTHSCGIVSNIGSEIGTGQIWSSYLLKKKSVTGAKLKAKNLWYGNNGIGVLKFLCYFVFVKCY